MTYPPRALEPASGRPEHTEHTDGTRSEESHPVEYMPAHGTHLSEHPGTLSEETSFDPIEHMPAHRNRHLPEHPGTLSEETATCDPIESSPHSSKLPEHAGTFSEETASCDVKYPGEPLKHRASGTSGASGAPSAGGAGTGASLKRTVSRVYETCTIAHGLKDPWGLRWRSHPIFLTAVVTVGIMSDILAYTIVAPILPFRLADMGMSNIAALTSWLLFAYSAGIFVGTFPTAWFFHKYPVRRGPLIAAVLIMIVSCITFMIPKHFAAMFISRFVQGLSSCIMWTVGFALICENIDPSHLGTHLGFAFTGLSLGATIAPPIGGALYKHMGWHAPFIFVIIILALDTIARLFIIEVKDIQRLRSRQWGAVREYAATGRQAEADALQRYIENAPHTMAEDQIAGIEEKAARDSKVPELSPWGVLKALVSLPRGVVAFFQFFAFGFVIGAFDATMAIRVNAIWHKDADFVGLIYLAGAVPSFVIGPLAGWASDRLGTEWVIGVVLVFCLPWIPLMTLKSSLAGFVVYFACANTVATALNTVASLEVAIVSKFRQGISEIHQFAAMNLAFAVSSAVGAIVGGQIYNNVRNGWDVLCWIGFALFALIIPPSLLYTGKWPLFWRAIKKPGPRSGIHPDELAKMDAEKADAEADATEGATGFLRSRHGSKDTAVSARSGGERMEMGDMSRDRSEDSWDTRKVSYDLPPAIPELDMGHRTSLPPH
ncbi:hypothetical protein CspeluHIS016_0104330 [Cutaneotrichosporon spelunceum]|uniref:Major facilitator superfamily (MFS) profile domain-containing protein n=1 Tax=Cutaneotrichosporon spelunceum TaxID=1672016 RepID=A0AAD3TNX7_9TREE|nr:hypothetical protein CspeluHIS016_0104330 [Cutaneotrichosporon spelunceum]